MYIKQPLVTGFYFFKGQPIITNYEVQSIDSVDWVQKFDAIKLKVNNLIIQEAKDDIEHERLMQEKVEKLAEEQIFTKEKLNDIKQNGFLFARKVDKNTEIDTSYL